MPRRQAYAALRGARPELQLPAASSVAAVDAALGTWEAAHPGELEEADIDAGRLANAVGGAWLNGRVDFVMVPAVADPEAETRDVRGTLLRQLLDRALGEQSAMRERLGELERRVTEDMREIVEDEGGQALVDLASSVSEELDRLVPGGQVLLEPRPSLIRLPVFGVDVRVADGELETDVGHQGHGFQRALLIAVVQRLAAMRPPPSDEVGASGWTPPTLFLAVEEPELYQHPLQARHFASTLTALAEDEHASVQVAYATHSEYFVDAANYRRLRRFSRLPGPWPRSIVTDASIARVARRLAGVYDAQQIALRVQMTLRRQVAEAVFAKAVLLVEGRSDAGLLHGVADRNGGFDADGIAVVAGNGKRQLLIPWAILAELGVPAYVVFDGDAGLAARRVEQGWAQAKAHAALRKEQAENEVVLRTLGVMAQAAPPTQVAVEYAVFEDRLEAETAGWPGFPEAAEKAREQLGDWREKSEDAYRQAAVSLESDPPKPLSAIVRRLRELAS